MIKTSGTKIFVLLILAAFLFANNAEAKVLPQAKKSLQKSSSATKGAGIGVSPKLRGNRKALVITFSNLQNASSVSYFLTYKQSLPSYDGKTSTQDEAALGALTLNGSSTQTTELLFGTCSKNVCRYHTGIKDAKLDISYTLNSGKKYLKKYRIKV